MQAIGEEALSGEDGHPRGPLNVCRPAAAVRLAGRAVRLAVMGSRRASPLAVAARSAPTGLRWRKSMARPVSEARLCQSVCAEARAGP